MEHIYEIYGSTEAVITTANEGDPIESVGRVDSSIITSRGSRECPPGIADEQELSTTSSGRRDIRRGGGNNSPLRGILRRRGGNRAQVPGRRLPFGRHRPHQADRRQALPVLQRPHRRLDPQGRRKLLGRERSAVRPGDARRGYGHRLRRPKRGLRRKVMVAHQLRRARISAGRVHACWSASRRRAHGPQVDARLHRIIEKFPVTDTTRSGAPYKRALHLSATLDEEAISCERRHNVSPADAGEVPGDQGQVYKKRGEALLE